MSLSSSVGENGQGRGKSKAWLTGKDRGLDAKNRLRPIEFKNKVGLDVKYGIYSFLSIF